MVYLTCHILHRVHPKQQTESAALPCALPSPLFAPPHRTEALAIGNIYTELLGEFGRFVGGSINAVQTLKKGVFVSPLELGVNHLEKTLQSLITVLQVGLTCMCGHHDVSLRKPCQHCHL